MVDDEMTDDDEEGEGERIDRCLWRKRKRPLLLCLLRRRNF